jgi:chemotaxis protein CheX
VDYCIEKPGEIKYVKKWRQLLIRILRHAGNALGGMRNTYKERFYEFRIQRFGREQSDTMANEKLAVLVNTFGSSLISVGRDVGLEVVLNKAKVSQGVTVSDICAASLIGVVGSGLQGTAVIMLDTSGFNAVISVMSGGMIAPNSEDPVAMSVVGELSNMVSGRSLTQANLPGVDVTPPQLIAGRNIQNIPNQSAGIKSFTLPFSVRPEGMLYLVLSFNAS